MTYASEGLRAALVPSVPHIAVWVCLAVMPIANITLLAIGVRGFYRRAID
jgi:ABC-2 type transport system permease protein